MIVDSSALLCLLLGEPEATWVATQLDENRARLSMSTVNLAEVLIRLRDLQPMLADEMEGAIRQSGIRFVPPDFDQARIAATARSRFPLNLGDCFAYALASVEGSAILTLDSDFRRTDHPAILPPRRRSSELPASS